jgi:hypothetical protein
LQPWSSCFSEEEVQESVSRSPEQELAWVGFFHVVFVSLDLFSHVVVLDPAGCAVRRGKRARKEGMSGIGSIGGILCVVHARPSG